MLDIFFNLRDLHTVYYMPFPYACYRNMMPFSLKEIKDGRNFQVVVSNVVTEPEFLALLPKNLNIEIGDELISYNGKSLRQIFKELAPKTGGANSEGNQKITLEELSFKIQTVSLTSQEDAVSLEFKKKNGKRFKTTLPWVNRQRLSCTNRYTNNEGYFHYQAEFNETYLKSNNENVTEEPTISWNITENEFGKIGILNITSFEPETISNVQDYVLLVENLLKNELAKADGLIIDVRNNPGGLIPFGESLLPLFRSAEKIERLNFRLNINDTNLFIIKRVILENDLLNAFKEAQTNGEIFSRPLPITDKIFMRIGKQAYFKPIAIFTNAHCYSTCDMFAAQMQDYGFAKIVGEDKTTGAGGANYIMQQFIYDDLPVNNKGQFKQLPNSQDMMVAWRQALRLDGSLIENYGVKSDIIVPATMEDILEDSKNQYLQISKILRKSNSN
jgi:C-terminal processing protease CtpA/Prc